jgi:hypothetical protein
MRLEIISKLHQFLENHSPISEESEVVYLMVELRKLLDRLLEEEAVGERFPLIRFYADWTVHTRKDRISRQMQEIMEWVDRNCHPYPKNGDLSFLSMPHLREEMSQLFQNFDLPLTFFEPENWLTFATILSQVLADQPIMQPTPIIGRFYYGNIGAEGIIATIDFSDGRGSITLGGDKEVI